ncbi:hypothetical protein ARMSODRAFT_123204 [Armillaria solidipes]|uniref:Uncharacterized protein n=1 Tax=Armillaria solidipes TaxID=1076256 RepID=A0A2H3BGR2_9AGAR|nr:hypothetical protein ARMSODRAFT_123204 [Armillaria solidipes]
MYTYALKGVNTINGIPSSSSSTTAHGQPSGRVTRHAPTAPHPDVVHMTTTASSHHRRSSRARDAPFPILPHPFLLSSLRRRTGGPPLPIFGAAFTSAMGLRDAIDQRSATDHEQPYPRSKRRWKVSLRQSLLAKGRSVHAQQGRAGPSHMDRAFPLPGEGGQSIPHTGENQSRISHATPRRLYRIRSLRGSVYRRSARPLGLRRQEYDSRFRAPGLQHLTSRSTPNSYPRCSSASPCLHRL